MSLTDLQYFSRSGDSSTGVVVLSKEAQYSVKPYDIDVLVDTSDYAVKVFLPAAKSYPVGVRLAIKDRTGNALTNPITVTSRADLSHPLYEISGEKIDGANTVQLAWNYSGLTFMSDGDNWLLMP